MTNRMTKQLKYRNFSYLLILFSCFTLDSFVFGQNIFDVARSGTVSEMKNYLQNHPEHVNQVSDEGNSPFLLAAYRGNNEVAKFLIEKGADLNSCYSEGSALYALIYKNNIELLKILLEKGVNVNDTCQFEQLGYPIHFALSLKRYDVISLMLKHNLDLSVKNKDNKFIDQLILEYNDPELNKLFN